MLVDAERRAWTPPVGVARPDDGVAERVGVSVLVAVHLAGPRAPAGPAVAEGAAFVRDIASHSAIEVTVAIYARASMREKRRVLGRLDGHLTKPRPLRLSLRPSLHGGFSGGSAPRRT